MGMKLEKYSRHFLYLVGLVLITISVYGNAHDNSCSSSVGWPSYAGLAGILFFGIGTLVFFRKSKSSWLKTILISLLLTIAIGVLAIIIAAATQPGGVWRCYTF